MNAGEATLEAKIDARIARIAVVGLGSVGLPLSRAFVDAGYRVLGFERDPGKLARIERGENTLHHLTPGLVQRLHASGRFQATGDAERLRDVDIALISVPTPLSPAREPDLECVTAAARTLASNLRRDALVVLESTTFPGTTRTVIGDVFREHGFEPGVDVLLAYSPEREDPGREDASTATIAKLVGGTCERSGDLAERLYRTAIRTVHRVSSAEVAESAKLLENVYRAANIALVNEFKIAMDALSLDVWEVIDAAATKPFGFMKFTPGPGLGGHCIPIDPYYLTWVARRVGAATPFIELAGEVNRRMPQHVVDRTRAALHARGVELHRARVLVLGLAYKAEVDTITESPAVELVRLFTREGALVEYSDPLVPIPPLAADVSVRSLRSIELDAESVASFDAVVVATDHAAIDYDVLAENARLVIDTRNALASRMRGRANYVKA
jgi:UDP-N-acetyl-D-glucosamine dehydrogenase